MISTPVQYPVVCVKTSPTATAAEAVPRISGKNSARGVSYASFPSSTSRATAALTMGLVIEASRNGRERRESSSPPPPSRQAIRTALPCSAATAAQG